MAASKDPLVECFSPDSRFPRVSRRLADLLGGSHSLEGMKHHTRVEYLYGMQVLHDATMSVGWMEHTNDWDWFVTVVLDDGTTLGTNYGDENEVIGLGFRLECDLDEVGIIPYVEGDYELKRVTHILLEVSDIKESEEKTERVEIDRIAQVIWDEEH